MKTEPYSHNVGCCYRCGTVVEPLTSPQWFVKTAPLAKEAINVVKDGRIKFVPERFEKTYFNWMENVQGLVYFASALVGTPYPCLLLRRLRAYNCLPA
ncbi:MAG: class I tRNA ligase family protein [Oscillospiraceae bacterium]